MFERSGYGWQTSRSVEEWLYAEGYRFDFYQAVRLLELLHPDSIPVAEGPDARQETVRFHSRVSFAFPASDVHEVTPAPAPGTPASMAVNFMGLAGAMGPLPTSFTELVLDRARYRDTGLIEFLDLFNHRLVSLLYRIRKMHRLQLNNASPEEATLARYIKAFMGLGLPELLAMMQGQKGGLHYRDLLGYAGLISRRPVSAAALQYTLAHYFRVPVRIQPLIGAWRALDPDQHTRIGVTGQNQMLGVSTVIGTRIWDQRGRFRIDIGPVGLERMREFLPIGSAWRPLAQVTRFCVGSTLDFTVRLRLKAEEIPETRLGSARLGWTSWLKTRPAAGDGTVELRPHATTA